MVFMAAFYMQVSSVSTIQISYGRNMGQPTKDTWGKWLSTFCRHDQIGRQTVGSVDLTATHSYDLCRNIKEKRRREMIMTSISGVAD